MNISELAKIIGGDCPAGDVAFSGVSIDTRTLAAGNLYIAIKGDRFDGHDFVAEAMKQGASAVLVEKPVANNMPQLVVKNTRQALCKFAQYHRSQFDIPVVGITGSCGKTTTRAMVESILKQGANVLASQRSYNNDIGVPLTLLQLDKTHEFAVIEMGANHAGEIANLVKMVRPTVSILTCAAEAHLAGFGDLRGVSRAKGEIFQDLPKTGTAVINADDQFADYWKSLITDANIATFGIVEKADFFATDIQFDAEGRPNFTLNAPDQTITLSLSLMGIHNVKNALGATAAVVSIGVSLAQVKQGLENALPVSGRLVAKKGWQGATIIDDSYNANPGSVAAAIDILVNRSGESVLVLGDMLEMGAEENAIHHSIGEVALKRGVSRLYCYGPLTQNTVDAFGDHALHFSNQDALITALKSDLSDNMTVLVKGSNSMKMNNVVRALLD